jgi:NAD+ synthase
MITLYYYTCLLDGIVVGTGNKVEDFGVMFFTKYGDGGVDINPIGDLLKSEVFEQAAYTGIHQDILRAKPTDGLYATNRTDEEQLGASYSELEWAMSEIACNGGNGEYNQRQKVVLDIYRQRNAAGQHKINPIPICSCADCK